MAMDEDQRLEYLHRDSVKKYSGWKNYSPNVWTALHWNPNGNRNSDPTGLNVNNMDAAKRRSNRPSTAPPVQFGLRFNSKNEIPQKVNYLMETVEDLQFQIQHFEKNLSQQNVLIENLTDVVEKLSIQNQQNKINKESINDEKDNIDNIDNDGNNDNNDNDKESDKECKENNDCNDIKSKSKSASPKKMAKVIVSKQQKKSKPTNNKMKGKGKIIPTYFAVDSKELKNKKLKSQSPKEKKGRRNLNRGNKQKKRAMIPRVVKSNKIKRKQLN